MMIERTSKNNFSVNLTTMIQVGLAGSINGQWWLDSIGDTLNEQKEFVLVASRQLAGLLIGAWYVIRFLQFI